MIVQRARDATPRNEGRASLIKPERHFLDRELMISYYYPLIRDERNVRLFILQYHFANLLTLPRSVVYVKYTKVRKRKVCKLN